MENRTVLVTGGSGFIGGVVCRLLVSAGHNVINVDRKKKEIPGVTQYPFDIDNHQVQGVIKLTKPDTIIHLAADHEVARSMQEPAVYYANNVANTIGLLNSAVTHGVKNFIFSSSSTVYGSAEQFPTTESTPTNPISPYGRSKQMVETMLSDYEAAYGIRCVALRYFNAAGAMPDNSHGYTQDPATHLIPIVARALANDQCITVFGDDYDTKDGTCERDYTHVCDIAQAHIAAMTMLDTDNSTGGVFNIGMGSPASVLDVLAAFEQVTGKPPVYTFAGRRTGDAAKTYADITLATGALGWAPEHTLEDIVRHAWAWETKKRKK
jgi:UDP-glucose-4-epimerase GalE